MTKNEKITSNKTRKNKYKLFRDLNKKDIISAIKNSFCVADILRQLGCVINDKNRKKLRRFCEENNISYEELIIDQLSESDYYKNPKYCKYCGKIIPYEKRENEYFCSRSCSASYTNKFRKKKTKNTNSLSSSVLKHPKNKKSTNNDSKDQQKQPKCIKCKVCGKENCNNEFCRLHPYNQLLGLVKVGLNKSIIGTEKIFEEFKRIKNIYYNEYWVLRKSILTIIEENNFNISQKTMYNIFDHLEIPKRSLSDSQKISILNGKHTLTNISISGNSIKHVSWCGKIFVFRSSYEDDYANELDLLKINYEFETIKIEYFDSVLNKSRIAIPDFYLPATKELIEIKSDFTLNIQEMLDKFIAYKTLGYIPKLILEHKEIDIYNIENIISKDRLIKIKTKNISFYKNLYKIKSDSL